MAADHVVSPEATASAPAPHVLLVEDDDSHAEIIWRTVRRSELVQSVDRVNNGVDFPSFRDMVHSLTNYWMTWNRPASMG